MALIDPKKLLNSSSNSGGGALVAQPKMFLVPVKNTEYKQTVDLSEQIQEDDLSDPEQQVIEDIKVIREKVVKIEDILKKTIKINVKKIQLSRKEDENKKRKAQEDKLEKKDKKRIGMPKIPIPGMSFIDRIKQFLGAVFAGFLVMQIFKLLPKLIEFLDYVKPVTAFIEDFVKGMFDKFVFAIDLGYKIVDGAQSKVKELFGDDGEKKFSEFTSTFTKFMNLAIIAGMATMGGQDPLRDRRFQGPQRRGFDRSGRRVSDTAQRRYQRRFGDRQYSDRFGNKNLKRLKGQTSRPARGLDQRLVQRGVTKVAGKNVGRIAGRIPIVGPIIDFSIRRFVFEEPLGKAAAGAVGAGVGQALGAWVGGTIGGIAGSVVPVIGNLLAGAAGATIGGLIGGLIGDQIGVSLYNVLANSKQGKIEGRSSGGKITQRTGRDPGKNVKRKKPKPVRIQKLKISKVSVGQSSGGRSIQDLYGTKDVRQKPLSTLVATSERLKRSGSSIMGKIMSLGVDYVLGQKPSKSTKKDIAKSFASLMSMISEYPDAAGADITKSFQALAGGGEVLRRDVKIRRKNEQMAGFMRGIEKALDKDIGSLGSLASIIRIGDRPFNDPYGGGGTPLDANQQAAFEKIKKIAEKVGSPNPSVTAAIAMLESGWLANPDSVYFASGKTNPFGQQGRGPKGFVIGKDGKEHAVYNDLEEGVKAHVDRWKQSYKGKDDREVIESIRQGLHGGPGYYNTNPNWTNQVMSVLQSSKAPKPSKLTSAQFKAVLPEGNPQLTSGYGPRTIDWGSPDHKGIDIGVDAGSRVLSLSDGVARIISNATWGSHGQAVVIDHGDGNSTLYGHVNPTVKDGQRVKKGDKIATVKAWKKGEYRAPPGDNTHLHLEYRMGGVGFAGTAVDPTGYLQSVAPKPAAKPANTQNKGVVYRDGKFIQLGGGVLGTNQAVAVTNTQNTNLRATVKGFGLGTGKTEGETKQAADGSYYKWVGGKWIFLNDGTSSSLAPSTGGSRSQDIGLLRRRTSYDDGVDHVFILKILEKDPTSLVG